MFVKKEIANVDLKEYLEDLGHFIKRGDFME